MQQTANYGLKKPEDNDYADISVLNENADKLDAALHGKIDATEKGQADGVATLGSDGKIPSEQLPAMDYDPAGAASAVQGNLNTHIADAVKHITAEERTAWNGKAAGTHTHAASQITAGTFGATGVKAASGTDYTTARVRNIRAGTGGMTAGSTALTNGEIYLQYE